MATGRAGNLVSDTVVMAIVEAPEDSVLGAILVLVGVGIGRVLGGLGRAV